MMNVRRSFAAKTERQRKKDMRKIKEKPVVYALVSALAVFLFGGALFPLVGWLITRMNRTAFSYSPIRYLVFPAAVALVYGGLTFLYESHRKKKEKGAEEGHE